MKKFKTIAIRREGFLQSVFCDIFSFTILAAFFWFNYQFIGGSYFVNFLIFLLIFIKLAQERSGEVRIFWKVSDKKIEQILKILKDND